MDSSLIEKIRKLLVLSKSTNENEAKLAAQKASELMQKHQIDMADVLVKEVKSEKIVRENYEVEGLRMKYVWVETLGNAVAKLFDGFVLTTGQLHGTRFIFVGYPKDIEAMKMLFEHLYSSWLSIVEADLKEAKSLHIGDWKPRDTMKFKLGHGQGYAHRIMQRCIELVRARKAAVSSSGSTGTALVVVKDQAIVEWKQQNGIKTVSRSQSTGSATGAAYGMRAGSNAALGGATTGG
jgi:hypothetical protein